ncbi:DsbE family thiol:disulfide interchange protein [Gilvimarinus sp. F26214L]|uniref:DsbE family thiol:disulfide interchange protein n=1 Tax=Gilvimarinus sp. DZF01 TaxID=3461371 RepID=UPI0040455B1E
MQRLKLFIPLIVFAGLAALFWRGLGTDPSELPSALEGRPVPEFRMTTVTDPQRQVTQDDLKGHEFALINVWATWCGPCRQEHPFLVHLAEQGIAIYGVNARDELNLAQEWLEQRGDPYVFSIFDPDGKLGLDLGVYGYPETFLIDKNGTVLQRKTSVLDERVWQNDFQPIIDQLNKS